MTECRLTLASQLSDISYSLYRAKRGRHGEKLEEQTKWTTIKKKKNKRTRETSEGGNTRERDGYLYYAKNHPLQLAEILGSLWFSRNSRSSFQEVRSYCFLPPPLGTSDWVQETPNDDTISLSSRLLSPFSCTFPLNETTETALLPSVLFCCPVTGLMSNTYDLQWESCFMFPMLCMPLSKQNERQDGSLTVISITFGKCTDAWKHGEFASRDTLAAR